MQSSGKWKHPVCCKARMPSQSTQTCINTHTHTHTHTHITHVHTPIHTDNIAHAHKHTHTRMHAHTHIHTLSHTHIYTLSHTHTHTYISTYASTQACTSTHVNTCVCRHTDAQAHTSQTQNGYRDRTQRHATCKWLSRSTHKFLVRFVLCMVNCTPAPDNPGDRTFSAAWSSLLDQLMRRGGALYMLKCKWLKHPNGCTIVCETASPHKNGMLQRMYVEPCVRSPIQLHALSILCVLCVILSAGLWACSWPSASCPKAVMTQFAR